jgi:hypothetical protein
MRASPALFILSALSLLVMGESTTSVVAKHSSSYLQYTTITGFFAQDDPSTDASTFNYVASHLLRCNMTMYTDVFVQATSNLGLLNRTYPTDSEYDPKGAKTQWQRFEYYAEHLTKTASKKEQYKVLYMGRHGEGYHNVAETFYGTPAWDVRRLFYTRAAMSQR